MKRLFALSLALVLFSGDVFGKPGRSYSGGSYSRPVSTPKPSTPSKSYSGGSAPSKGYTSPKPAPSTPVPQKPAEIKPAKSYSGGSKPAETKPAEVKKTYTGGSNVTTSTSIKPEKSNFDSLGTKEQMKVESRQLYNKGQTPKTEYKTAAGKEAKIDPKDVKIERLRGQLDQQKWANRELRQQQFYGGYYARPVVVYNDPYPSFFWWWLLDRSLEERAMWAYCHRHDMDSSRYQALLAKDAQLEAKIRQLESQGVKADPTYAPKGMDRDLMYTNEYVDAVYNPAPTSLPENTTASNSFSKFFLWSVVAIGVVFLIWFVFIRET